MSSNDQQQPIDNAATQAHLEDELPDLDFNVPIGACQGVIAFSNIDEYYFSGEKAFFGGVYTGYKYQCVEFARRYMMLTQGCIFPQCGPAADIFKMDYVENLETGGTLDFVACKNKETDVKPAVGMTLIYPIDKKLPVGHVAVISYVGEDFVGIAEQNYENKSWQGKPYGRKVPLIKTDDGKWHMKEDGLIWIDPSGWLFIKDHPFRPIDPALTEAQQSDVEFLLKNKVPYSKLNIQEKYVEVQSTVTRLVRFDGHLKSPTVPNDHVTDDYEAAEGTINRRHAIAAAYSNTLSNHFEKSKSNFDHHHVVQREGPPSQKATVKRSGEWASVYTANETLFMKAVSGTPKAYKVIERCIHETLVKFADKTATDAEVVAFAKRFHMPADLLVAAAKNMAATDMSSENALSRLDFLLGTIGVIYDEDSNSVKVLHAEFDSLNCLIDINLLQEEYSTDVGLQAGWRMTSFGNDFHRTVKGLQKFRFGIRNADSDIVFVDFGPVRDLEKYGIKLNDEAAYLYEVERWQNLYMFEYLLEFLAEKKKEFEAGEIEDKDVPKWNVRKATFFDDETVAVDGDKLVVNGDAPEMLWKMCPWSTLFNFKGQNAKVDQFLAASTSISRILQPIWTHVTTHPHFLPLLSKWAEEEDKTAPTGESASLYTLPAADWTVDDEDDADGRPICFYNVKTFDGVTNPENPAKAEPRGNFVPDESRQPTFTYAHAFHSLVAGGKRSGSVALEGRSKAKGKGRCTIYDLVHPAPMAYMPFLKHVPDWHSTSNNKSKAEKDAEDKEE